MGNPSPPEKALLICSIFSRHSEALAWCKQRLAQSFGRVALESTEFPFSETNYYAPSMGEDLRIQLVAFNRLIDSSHIKEIKLAANGLEAEYAALNRHAESRPVNIDPGCLTQAKFVLATTKDAGHRIYLGEGIFAEVTLHYRRGEWQDLPWTYPNYRRADYKAFLQQCRERLRGEIIRNSESIIP